MRRRRKSAPVVTPPRGLAMAGADDDDDDDAFPGESLPELAEQVRSIHWFPYDRVGVVNADP